MKWYHWLALGGLGYIVWRAVKKPATTTEVVIPTGPQTIATPSGSVTTAPSIDGVPLSVPFLWAINRAQTYTEPGELSLTPHQVGAIFGEKASSPNVLPTPPKGRFWIPRYLTGQTHGRYVEMGGKDLGAFTETIQNGELRADWVPPMKTTAGLDFGVPAMKVYTSGAGTGEWVLAKSV